MLPYWPDLWQKSLGWCPSQQQQQQLQQLYQEILKGNRQLNLTRITSPEAFWEKHLWDSLRGLTPVDLLNRCENLSMIDIGTGAGFPGFPCAIALPYAQITLLDSTAKKIAYLTRLIGKLGLNQVQAQTGRAETVGPQSPYYQHYDYALLRAVASATVCAKYAFPFLTVGGIAILYRGRWTRQEEIALEQTLANLGGELWHIEAFSTPLSNSERHCLYLKKTHYFL